MRRVVALLAVAGFGVVIALAASKDGGGDTHSFHERSPSAPATQPRQPSQHEGHDATALKATEAPHDGKDGAHAAEAAVPSARPPHAPAHEGHGGATSPAPTPAAKGAKEEPRAPVDVPAEQQMRIGLATKPAAKVEHVQHAVRAVGNIVADQRREAQVHTRVAGWIDDISVSAVGQQVKRGQVLYRLYAPELVSTQQELVGARREGDLGRRISEAALERLALWGVAPFEIEELRNGGAPKRSLAFLAPASGYVIDKMAVKGAYVTPEMELYRIADLSKVWVLVSLFENELSLVRVGDVAEVKLSGLGSSAGVVRAPISFIYPELDTATRAGRARIEIENKDLAFKPGMFAEVSIEKGLGEAVVVPEDAIIFTGQRNLVFKKTSATRFVPVEVTVGPRVESGRVILAGIAAGDELVVRASFLIDAESRLQAALQSGGGAAGGHTGHGG